MTRLTVRHTEATSADLFHTQDSPTPSNPLRGLLGSLLADDVGKRLVIPAFLHRINRCTKADVSYFRQAFGLGNVKDSSGSGATMAPVTAPGVFDQAQGISPILAALIKPSEMWTSPLWEDKVKESERRLFSADLTDTNPHIDFSILDMPKMTYTPETKYWYKLAKVPDNASVLVINGKLDFFAVSDSGVREYENLQGDQKMLVEFEYGAHGSSISPSTFSDESWWGHETIARSCQWMMSSKT